MSEYICAEQISNILGICYSKALDFIKYSGIPYIKIGRVYRVSATDFNDFIKSNKNINTEEMSHYERKGSHQKTHYKG